MQGRFDEAIKLNRELSEQAQRQTSRTDTCSKNWPSACWRQEERRSQSPSFRSAHEALSRGRVAAKHEPDRLERLKRLGS
jgi:hypothetical protein